MSRARPGNPQVDIDVVDSVGEAVRTLKKQIRNLDARSLSDCASLFHEGLASVAKYQGVRLAQATAAPGGRRRKRY